MKDSKWINIFLTLFLLALVYPSFVQAGSTGKIAGVVLDKATGEGLPGPNVEVLGTTLGAAADVNGMYVVLNILPGTYTVRFSMLGYNTVEVTEVKINTDRITKLDVELQETILEGEVITVEATREAVEFDRTNTAAYVGKEEIEAMPVKTLSDIIQLQAGVVKDAGGALHFRGGRSREVAYLIDGVPVTNTFSQGGGSNVNIENNFIQELQVITGTFNAEYGSAQSGVINVVTKVPEDKLDITVDAMTGGYFSPGKVQFIGLDKLNLTSEKEIKLSLSTPLPFPAKWGKLGFYVNGRFADNDGWLNGERRFNTTDGWEIELYRYWYEAAKEPDDPLIIPIPDSLHTGDGAIVPMNWQDLYNINTKLVYQPSSAMTLAYNMFWSKTDGKGYASSWRFCPDGTNQYHNNNFTHMLTYTHTPSQNLYYNLRYSFQQNSSESYAFESADDPLYQVTAVNAWDPGKMTGYDYGGIQSWDRRWYEQYIHLVNGDLTWQISKIVEIKVGGEAKNYDLHYKNAPMREKFGYETLQYPYTRNEIRGKQIPWQVFKDATKDFEHGTILLRETHPDSILDDQYYVDYKRKPLEASAYAQTRLNMGDIILNAGLRLDYFRPNDRYAPDYSIVYPELVGHDSYYVQAKEKYQLSPRFGLSFPISSRGAMRLSYGHFFQMPSLEKLYQNPVLSHYNQFSIKDSRIGNPNLEAEKTVQYEIGLQQELVPGLAMELTVYYKDIRDLLGLEILTLSNGTTFYRYVNKEYGNSSGVTLAFNQRSFGGILNSSIDYTYMVAKGTASSPEAVRDVAITAGPGRGAYTIAERRISFLNWDQTHSLNTSISLRPTPNWNISIIGWINSGFPYTPATLNTEVEIPGTWWNQADRKPLRWNVDLKVARTFQIGDFPLTAYIDIYNIFDHLNENGINSLTGRAGPNAYLPEIGRLRYSRISQIGEFSYDEADYDPSWYSRPRLIQFGIFVQL